MVKRVTIGDGGGCTLCTTSLTNLQKYLCYQVTKGGDLNIYSDFTNIYVLKHFVKLGSIKMFWDKLVKWVVGWY